MIQLYILFPLILKIFNKYPKATLTVSFLSTLLLNQFWNYENKRLIFASWILYFVLGMLISKKKDEEVPFKVLAIEYFSFLLSLILFVVLKYRQEVLSYEVKIIQVVFVISSTLGCILFSNLFKKIENEESKLQNAIIDYFEPNTYLIFLYHVLFIAISQYDLFVGIANSPGKVFVGLVIFTSIAILMMCFIANFVRKKWKILIKKD